MSRILTLSLSLGRVEFRGRRCTPVSAALSLVYIHIVHYATLSLTVPTRFADDDDDDYALWRLMKRIRSSLSLRIIMLRKVSRTRGGDYAV